ncbi:MAG: glycine zipper family protein [Ferruginibacter sp.]
MKSFIIGIALTTFLFSCKNKSTPEANKNMVLIDTSGFYKSNLTTDVSANGNVVAKTKTVKPSSTKPKTTSSNNTSSNSNNTKTTNSPVVTKQDKGWSSAAKGTAIGTAGGAVIGAVVSKDKVKGAVIGGVLGAGTGYVIGRDQDRKSGRVARKRAARQ